MPAYFLVIFLLNTKSNFMSRAIFLASTSPRRRELLMQIGVRFSVLNVAVDESRLPHETPEAYVQRVALAKAQAGLRGEKNAVVIAADTTVTINDAVLGKPASLAEALAMWQLLSGREHRVLTAVAVACAANSEVQVVETRVQFREISHAEMLAYWHSGEPADKAGGYAIQGLAAIFVQKINGSYSNVVGLPLCETAAMLARFDVPVWSHVL